MLVYTRLNLSGQNPVGVAQCCWLAIVVLFYLDSGKWLHIQVFSRQQVRMEKPLHDCLCLHIFS